MSVHVYIDGANLYRWVKGEWWEIDYVRFRKWLKDKYKAEKVYLFMWYIKWYEKLYTYLSKNWYILIFKETLEIKGKVKWNCDAELVVEVMKDYYESNLGKVILVTWDGDFACVIDFLKEKVCSVILLAPSKKFCSFLLKKRNIPIVFIEEIKRKFQKILI